jgi:large subunit ribosomal protein L2
MSLKAFNPVTPSLRGTVIVDRSDLWKGKPVKTLTIGMSSTGGRNNQGRITSWHKGGGHKQKYRIIDFMRNKLDVEAVVERIEYDPNRTAFIALLRYTDGTLSYIVAPQKLSVGDKVIAGENVDIKPGNALPLRSIPIGTIIHNVEMKSGKGAQLARSAGSYIQLVGKDVGNAQLRLRSGELRVVSIDCMATIGSVSNPDQQNIKIGKAGRNRWLGRRPVVRGVAMNPIDHPHGGGEGKTSGGRHPCTPWGKSTKGKKTRKNKFTSKFIIRSRHAEKGRK